VRIERERSVQVRGRTWLFSGAQLETSKQTKLRAGKKLQAA